MNFEKEVRKDLLKDVITNLENLILVYNKLKTIYEIQQNKKASQIPFKVRNYKKWISLLKTIDNDNLGKLIDIQILKDNKVSDKCINRIIEINDTNKLKDLQENQDLINTLQKEIKDKYVKNKTEKSKSTGNSIKDISYNAAMLSKIYGIGDKTCQQFLKQNITIDNLFDEWKKFTSIHDNLLMPPNIFEKYINGNFDKFNIEKNNYIKNKFFNTKYLKILNYGQLVGLKYFNDIQQRIPRKEIKVIEKILKKCLKAMNKDLIMEICGSYRRGKEDSGDIDVLICHPDIKENEDFNNLSENILLKLVMFLTKAGFLTEHLTLKGNTKYMGLCKLSNTQYHRRIDIIFKPFNCFPSSLLYFTGSGDLNKMMREHAIRKGMKLNEYGLFKTEFDKKKNKIVELYRIECYTEKEIFEKLEYKWLKPTERNI